MRRIITLAVLLAAATFGQDVVLACGAKFFLVGTGGRLSRANFASLHPGTVLIYTGGTTSISKALRNVRLHQHIKSAGHSVVLAGDRAELQKALASGTVDVILGGLGQAMDLVADVGSASSKPTVLPIQGEGADATSPHQFAAKLKSSDNVIRFLKGIEDAMKARTPGARG
jgi:hypothetical protein